MKVFTMSLLLGTAVAYQSANPFFPPKPMEKQGMDVDDMGMGGECTEELPEIGELIKMAFPEDVDGGIWNSNYLTKKWNGMDPSLGGYPTPIDTRYPFEAVASWWGQPGGGTPHHCPDNSPADTPPNECPKLIVNSDDGPYGPGHTPPHIALRAVSETHCEAEDWFDYDNWGCDIPHDILLGLIRRFYPRDPDTGAVDYPPPDVEGTPEYYPYEFPGNRGPHWCTQDVLDEGIYGDYCPYEPEGRYRHPHLALAAVNVYLANMYMPDQCGPEWMDQLPEGVTYPPQGPDTAISFPVMDDEDDPNSQPAVPYEWPGPLGPHKQWFTPGTEELLALSLIVTDDNGDLAPPACPAHGLLPEIGELIKMAFPEDVDGGIWNSNYLTKKWNGMDPSLGGYPTPIDTRYPFEAVAAWLGQPGGGTPHHCPDNSPADTPPNECPKLIVNSDDGPYGPGHTPPHIALRAVSETHCEAEDWFDYDNWGCDIPHDILLGLIRRFYPRDPDTGAVDYPPPDVEGTPEYYPYEFPGNRGPHWCTQDVLDEGIYGDYCPYEPEGRYRHPHLALAAVNVYLANIYMPDQCGPEWMDQLPEGVTYPPQGPDTAISFPVMDDEDDPNSQPAVPYEWPGPLGPHKQWFTPGTEELLALSLIVTDDNGELGPTPE